MIAFEAGFFHSQMFSLMYPGL